MMRCDVYHYFVVIDHHFAKTQLSERLTLIDIIDTVGEATVSR